METNIPGVFACGDIRNTPLKQAVTAASDGSLAATMAIAFVVYRVEFRKSSCSVVLFPLTNLANYSS